MGVLELLGFAVVLVFDEEGFDATTVCDEPDELGALAAPVTATRYLSATQPRPSPGARTFFQV